MNLIRPLWFTWKGKDGYGRVEAIYKLKYFIICRQKNTGKMARAQGKDRENTGNLVLGGVPRVGTPQPGCTPPARVGNPPPPSR